MDKKNKTPNVPNLRFKEFHTEWKKLQIGNLIKERKEYTSDFEKYPLYSFTLESGITPKSERYERSFLVKKEGDLFKIVHQNDFVMNPMNLRFGAINYSKINQIVSVSGYYDIFTIDECKYNEFWNAYFKTPRMIYTYNTIATGSLVEKKRVYFKQLKELKMYIPNDMEKNKINEFINLLNERIQTQIKIIDDLVLQKKYIIYSLLESIQDNEKIMLKDILFDYNVKTAINNEYPVLSSTASGMYLQTEYFNKEAASDNTTGYKIIPRGYCTYRSMSDTGLFTFNIQNLVEKGIVSPAYPVFSANNYINEFIILYLNNASYIKKQILELKSGGTRFALPFSTLCTLKIPKIEKEKQLSFIKTITAFERKIKNEEIILNDLHQQKNYLLNNMFI